MERTSYTNEAMGRLDQTLSTHLTLPRLLMASFHHFTLYAEGEDVTVQFSKEVTCLAGANGIGKSTLLACLAYGLTGVLQRPSYRFLSIPEFYDNASFAQDYFSGRIAESHRSSANVDVTFAVGDSRIYVRRSLFTKSPVDSILQCRVNDKELNPALYES
ncbi:MAG: AAA family ATPase, partial [Vulcanimicrobiaceae bacterium]